MLSRVQTVFSMSFKTLSSASRRFQSYNFIDNVEEGDDVLMEYKDDFGIKEE